MSVQEKFSKLGTDNAPGQEVRQKTGDLHALRQFGARHEGGGRLRAATGGARS